MTDEDLIQYATDFRSGLLGDLPSDRMCFVVCSPLAGLLAVEGVEAELVETDLGKTKNHVWLRLSDGRALDPTADQFGEDYPAVYLGPRLGIHKGAKGPPAESELTEAGADLVRSALDWLGATDKREKANARRRFDRRVKKAAKNPLEVIGVHCQAVGYAREILEGRVELLPDRQLALTIDGARSMVAMKAGET